MKAQDDSLRSPFSVYFGSSLGCGKYSKGISGDYSGFDALQYDDAFYADYNNRIGFLWNEKAGVTLLFGQLANTNRGTRFHDYALTAYNGYTFLVEYSDMHYGYRYRYITPQFTFRMGREPFNYTLNAGVGIGKLHGSDGIAIYKNDTSNMFIQQRYTTTDSWNVNAAVSFEAAYMRQLSQHWFLNTGFYLSYTAVQEKYEYSTTVESYGSPIAVTAMDEISNLQHHGAVGIFAYFQWNTKESERAYYE
jgi:hypothetical protein